MDMQRLLILRGLPEALKAFRSDKDFEGRLVEALRMHLGAGPRDSLYYQDRGTDDGQAFVVYLFNRAEPGDSPGLSKFSGDECLYRAPYAVTPGGALEFSFGPPEKVRERRDYVPEGEIAKAGPVANRPGLALDPTSHRWKKTGGGARPGLTLNKESREIVHHDEAPNDAAAAAYEHQQAAAGHAEKVAEWVKKSRDWPRREDGSPINATAYKKSQRHSDKHGEAWAAHRNAMTGHLHGSAAPGESDHAREKSKHANEWSAANGFGQTEALKAKARGDDKTLDMFGGGAAAAPAKPAAAPAKPAPAGDDETHATVRKAQELMEVGHPSPFGQSWAAHSKATIDAAHRQAFPHKYGAGDPTHGGHLTAQKVTDKAGHQTTRYKKAGEAAQPAAPKKSGAKTAAEWASVAKRYSDSELAAKLRLQEIAESRGIGDNRDAIHALTNEMRQRSMRPAPTQAGTPVKVRDAQAGAEHKIPPAPAKARGKAETEALATATKAGPVADGTADWQMSDAHHAASKRHIAAARAFYDAADKVKDPTEMKALGDAHNAAAEAHSKARKQHDADSRKDSSPEGERLTKIANEASAAAAAAHPEAKASAADHVKRGDWHMARFSRDRVKEDSDAARVHQDAARAYLQGDPKAHDIGEQAHSASEKTHEAWKQAKDSPAPASGPDKVTLNRYGEKTEHAVKHSAGRYHVIPYPPTPSTNGRAKHYPDHYTVVEAGENGEADTSSIAGHLTQDEAASLATDLHDKAPGGFASLRGNLQAMGEHVTRTQLAKDRSAKHLPKPVIK